MRQLGAGVDVDQGTGQHADLADPVEDPGANGGQTHRQVDDEEREDRHQPQGEQIETAFLFHPGVDGFQPLAELTLHPVAQHETRGEEGQGGTDGGGEGDDERAPPQAEDGARNQGHDRRARQRQAGHRHVNREEEPGGQGRLRRAIGFDGGLLGFEEIQAEVAAQIEGEEGADQ